ncbi:MAG: response regulator [Candidatus Margulisbacteria bacterium]|nr:response regulator [Candidatus Margulisiibacteriota bacterium]
MNILVIDDKKDILFLVKTILEMESYDVTTVNNGDEGIELCKENAYPIIFLDLMMEGKDGFATLKEIRETKLNKKAYIIALTAKAYESDKKEVVEKGFDDHFSKPFRATEIITKVRNCLKK